MNILVFGAGSMGTIFAGFLSKNVDNNVDIYARGARYTEIAEGYTLKHQVFNKQWQPDVTVVNDLDKAYDVVIVALGLHHIEQAMDTIKAINAPDVMFFFNCPEDLSPFVDVLGERLLWGFPAALGRKDGRVTEYMLMNRPLHTLQVTTLGELDGRITARLLALKDNFEKSGIPTALSRDIESWLKTHAGLMMPIMATAFLNKNVQSSADLHISYKDAELVAQAMKDSFVGVLKQGGKIEPLNLLMMSKLPSKTIAMSLYLAFKTTAVKQALLDHALNMPEEVALMHKEITKWHGDNLPKSLAQLVVILEPYLFQAAEDSA